MLSVAFNFISKNQKGMTLTEVLVVVLILAGIYATAVTVVFPRMERSKISQAKILISRLSEAVDTFYLDCSYYPSSTEGLEALVLAPDRCETWGPEPYIKRIPTDPWKNEFVYEFDENTGRYIIMSFGKDGQAGGSNLYDEDISSEDI